MTRAWTNARQPNKITKVVKRFLIPSSFTSLYYFLRFRATVSPRAEVELSRNVTFGHGCTVSSFTKLKATDGPVKMGARCGIGTGCFLSADQKGIIIGDNVLCGPHVSITASNYNYDELDVPLEDQGQSSRGIRIGKNVWIGAGCAILDGSVVGDNTVIVANSLVNRRYPPNSVLQGNPAKVIFRRG